MAKTKAQFNTADFLSFLFTSIFFFVASFTLLHYVSTVCGFLITVVCKYFLLGKNTKFYIRSFHIAPLQARIFFQNVFYQNENFSLRIVDGYVTFAFWAFWFKSPNWTRVHEYMVSESLIGTRCRININLKSTKGVIVGIDEQKRKIHVQIENSSTAREEEDFDGDEEDEEEDDNLSDGTTEDELNRPFDTNIQQELKEAFYTGTKTDKMADVRVPIGSSTKADPLPQMSRPGDEVIRTFDASDVKIRSKPGRIQLHINGMRFSVFNATGKYRDLVNPGGNNAQKKKPSEVDTFEKLTLKEKLVKTFKKKLVKKETDLDGENGNGLPAEIDPKVVAARKIQVNKLKNKTLHQKLFSFISSVEIELFTSIIDIGGAGASHPYFLHTSFQRGEGRVFLTRDGCPTLDLYRTVTELTLDNVDIRMAQMDSKLTETQFMRNTSLRDRAQLLFRGRDSTLGHDFDTTQSSDLIRNFGIVVDGKHRSKAHIVFYKDTPNIYGGEEVVRGKLPTTGFELLIDSPEICYGPWLEYCRFQLFQFFLPPNYRPLERLQFEIGQPRPNASFEFFVEFIRETKIVVPFKRRSVVPSPPFGIKDSHERGYLNATIGAGSQYIQPGFYLLPNETRQNFQSLFISNNISVRTNCVLGKDSLFAEVDSLQFFLDRQDDILWNGRKLWNILPKLSGAMVHFYFCYVDFFLDLLNDWQFTAQMYHNVPLTTELFNTYDRVVKFCIPNVKRFEVFVEGNATLLVNVNKDNVVFSEDPNDPKYNTFAKLKVRTATFSMVLPADQYQLSYENEIVRPIRVTARDIKAYLSLPPGHPLYNDISAELPWAVADKCDVKGLFSLIVGNQAIPQDRYNLNPSTGRTRLHNYFNLELEFHNTRGTLMAAHILCLLNTFHNIFLDHMMTIHPDELFWLLAKLQSNATTGQNKRKEFKQFLESSQPAGNDLEICVNVKLINTEANLTTSMIRKSPKLNVRAGVVAFTYSKQFAVTNTAVNLSPITLRVDPSRQPSGTAPRFLCVGDISVGLIKHFGRMPLKPKIHDSMDIKVGGVTFNLSLEDVLTIAEVAKAVVGHLKLDDANMNMQVDKARAVAELAAETTLKRSTHANVPVAKKKPVLPSSPLSLSSEEQSTSVQFHTEMSAKDFADMENLKPKKKKKVFFLASSSSSDSDEDTGKGKAYTSFANEVSFDVASEFAKTMDACNKANDESKDYGLFFTFVTVVSISGRLKIADEGWLSVDVPSGLSLAESTLNDGNSNKRLSLAAKDFAVHAFVPIDKLRDMRDYPTDHTSKKYTEIFHLQTTVCVRQYTAYPFDGSLENHMYKQRQFIKNNDYEELINFRFFDVVSPPQSPHGGPNNETYPVRDPPTQARQQRVIDATAKSLQALIDQSASESEESSSEPSGQESASQKSKELSEPGTLSHELSQDDETTTSPSVDFLQRVPTCASGKDFETCLSASDASVSNFLGDSNHYDYPFDDESLMDESVPNLRPAEPPAVNKGAEFILRERIPLHRFYRVFFSTDCDENGTVLGFTTNNRKDRTSSVRYHAPLPNVPFILVEYPEEFPEYTIAREFYENCDDSEELSWATGCADNRKRSLQGSTTKHLHLELAEPLTVLVSKEFSPLVTAALRVVMAKYGARGAPLATMQTRTADFDEKVHGQMSVKPTSFIRETKKGKKSTVRKQQKRWQWEDILASAIIPCVELKLMTCLPVPSYNLPTEKAENGMYSTTLGIRGINGVLRYNRPPSGVESASSSSRKMSASVSLKCLSLVTQIEDEPIAREGKLTVDAPLIVYDESKDNIGVIYIAKIRGRGKRDVVRSAEGGACSVLVDTVGIHVTKDYISYLLSLFAMADEMRTDFMQRVYSETWSGVSSPLEAQRSSQMISSSSFHKGTVTTERGRTVQGKGNIRLFRVVMINSFKHGRYIKLDIPSSSVFEVSNTMANFVIVTPRATRDNCLHLQFIGDVDALRIKLYPSLLHCINTPSLEGGTRFLQKNDDMDGGTKESSEFPSTESGLLLLYTGTFTLHTLDISVMHSAMNYLQLRGKNLTGCAEARNDRLSSRECVQVDVLTEAISERLKARLRAKARAARERASQSRYASPSSVTGQLQLRSTASFFAEQLLLRYVAEVILPKELTTGDTPSRVDPQVIIAAIDQVAIAAQFTDQFDIVGKQINLEVSIHRVYCVSPFRPESSSTVHPQIQQIVTAWKLAAHALSSQNTDGLTTVIAQSPKKSTGKGNQNSNSGLFVSIQAKNIEGIVGLPQNISQKFFLPQLSLIVQTSSNGRVGAQVHAHPFSITSKSNTLDNYQVTLPHMYLIYAHDQIKLTCSVMVETVAITVTPLFINHTLLTIEKMKELIVATQQTIPHTNSQGAATNTGGEPAPRPGKRQTFLFLLRGLSFSYLTSMTNLRFSLKSLNATAETSVLTGFSVLDWTVHVSTLQVALVDRDDHDQMTTRSKLVPPLHKHAPKSGGASKPHTPLGGFIWGSLEFSLTLSSDMTNYNNEVQETLRKEASFQACSPELQKALLDTVGHSTYRWVLSVYSPLVILRVGLESLLKQCLDETQADIWELKNAATKEGERFRMMLSNEKTFKKLQAQKRRYDALIRKNESEHAENVRRVAERVARDVSLRRRNAIGNEESDILELLRITSKHRFVTTISNFLIVVPFGDATFKSLLEEDPKMFSCGKNTKHIHNATCILRKKTLPTLALRVGIDEITFTCGVESVRHFAPILLSDVDKSFLTSELKVTGRLFSSKLVAYFTTGSPIPSTSHLQRLLEDTVVLGGVGILTLDNREEIQKTRNTILIEIIESPFHIEKKDGVFSIGAIMDISGPKICLSSRFPIFVSQLQNEFPTTSLPHARGDSSQMSANLDEGATSENVPVQPGKSRRRSSSSSAQNNYFVLDVSARLGIGSVRFFSFGKKESQPVNDNENIFTRKFTHSSRKSQKGNKTARVVTPAEEQNIAFGGKSRMPEGNMNLMLTVPLPSVVTQIAAKRSTDMNEEDVSMVRCEIRSGSIEIGPSIIGFFKDIEQAASDYGFHKQECEKNILQKVKEIENGVTSKKIALHCTVTDLLVPVPRAYATELFNSKIRQYTSKRKTRADPPRQPCQGEQRSVVVKPSYLSIHLSLLEFSLILTSEPVASTNLTVFLGDRGSVDLLVKVYRGGSHAVLSRVPDNTIIMNVRRLRAECQTKLEVKSVEVFLPEGEVVISKRVRHDDVVNSIAVNLPFNVEGTDPNLILRVPHIAQVFTIQQLWTSVIGEALEQMKGVFLSASSPLLSVPQPISAPVQTNGNERTLVVIYVSYGLCHFDLGTGNSHQLLFGTGRLAAEKRVCGGHSGVNLLRCHISNFSTKSEGVLAGVVSIGDIIAQGFVIENMESSETFQRSPESRTFRSRVIVKNVHVAFKERQVKDVFECKSTLFDLNSMDGVGVDGYTTSDLDVLLSRATLGVTPSTVPAFLTFIKSVSFMVADQKRIANEKLKEDKVPVGRLASISTQIKEVLYSWESRRSSADNSVLRRLSESEKPFNEAYMATARDSLPKDVPVIPFFGNRLTHVPCGQLRFTVDETTLLLGAISSAEATTGCVVASFPKTRLSFAECPSDDYTAAKKMLIIETRNVELYRPGSYKIVIMGFRGDNYFEFFTKQEMGSADVFFTLLLKQTHPWTGNPRFRDFEEMISLIKSFADKKNADVFQKFGSVDANFNANSAQVPPSKAASEAPAVDEEEPIPIHVDATDPRVLKALRGVNFSPQLRFGGDVSVNTEVILNWIGITEKMLPTVLNSKLCDGLEGLLDKFAEITSERTKEQI